jgi:hypothetical protein
VKIEGRFVRRRVLPINHRGVFKGGGFLSIEHGYLHVLGRRVPSLIVRWVLGLAWYLGLIVVGVFALRLAFPNDSLAGQTGLSIPIVVLAYLAANYFHWVGEDFKIPLSSVRDAASDPMHNLLAVSISEHPHATPIVMLVNNPLLIGEALSELKPNVEAKRNEGA